MYLMLWLGYIAYLIIGTLCFVGIFCCVCEIVYGAYMLCKKIKEKLKI